MNREVYAVIVAAGRGSRFGADLPKQFCPLAGRPMLMTTIDRIAEVVGRERVVIAIDPSMEDFWHSLCKDHGFESPKIAYGGATRVESVNNALQALGDVVDSAIVMVHDGARPLATAELIRRMTLLPDDAEGMIPAIPVSDSLREYTDKSSGASIAIDRSRYAAVQTPQTFRLNELREAHRIVLTDSEAARRLTDDASVMEAAFNARILLAEGEPTNIKVTNPLDIRIAEVILESQAENHNAPGR